MLDSPRPRGEILRCLTVATVQALGLFYLGLFWYRRCLEPLAECGARGFDSLQFHKQRLLLFGLPTAGLVTLCCGRLQGISFRLEV